MIVAKSARTGRGLEIREAAVIGSQPTFDRSGQAKIMVSLQRRSISGVLISL